MSSKGSKASALGWITIAYVVCVAAGYASLVSLNLVEPWNAFVADVVATVVIFGFSLAFKNSSFYDAYWGVIPPLLAMWWFEQHAEGIDITRAYLVIALV